VRAKYKLSERKTLSYIQGDSWTGRISWMRDVHAILCLFVSYAIWTMHAFRIEIHRCVLAMWISEECILIREIEMSHHLIS
jgi:hypothetical protein